MVFSSIPVYNGGVTLVPLLLTLAQAPADSPDPRLDVKATLEAPRLTYAEIGAWVQKETKIPVYVVPVIRERKATVLVENRPVKEVMDRISEALFVEWERTKDGYTMRISAKVMAEEAAMAGLESNAAREALRWKLNQMAALGRKSKDSIKSELDGCNAEYASLAKDTSPEAAARRAELSDRIGLLSNAFYSGYSRSMSMFAAQMPPSAQAGLFNGQAVYGSATPRPGYLPLGKDIIDAIQENYGSRPTEAQERLYSVRYIPATQEVNFSYATSEKGGASGTSLSVKGMEGAQYRRVLAESPLGKRLREWAVTDAKFMETKVAPKPNRPEERHQTPYKTLADLLVDLHQRSGVPIVADAYRQALVARRLPDGDTLAKWNTSLNPWSDGRYRGYRPIVRSGSGWLMMRHPQYWQRVAGEVAEGPIRRLETACKVPGKATIDDFATFAAAVTRAQEPFIGPEWLVMETPTEALNGKLNPLRLWAALPAVLRRTASGENGLELRPLQPNLQRLAAACLNERKGTVFATLEELPYILPGAPPLPDDIRLFVNLNTQTMNMEYQEFIQEEPDPYKNSSWNSMTDSVAAVSMRIGNKSMSLANYSIPLRPSRKIWPDP